MGLSGRAGHGATLGARSVCMCGAPDNRAAQMSLTLALSPYRAKGFLMRR